jgi:hypothetical protein
MSKQEIFEGDDEIKVELIQASKEIGREQLKERLNKLDRPINNRSYLRMWFAAAAMIIVLIAAVFLMKPTSPEAIYSSYYEKLPNKVVAITRSVGNKEDLKKAMIAYEDNNYDGLLQEITTLEKTYPEVAIYKGTVLLEEKNFKEAISALIPLSEDESYAYNDEAKWYLALAYLMDGQVEDAHALFTGLSKSSEKHKKESAAILKKL